MNALKLHFLAREAANDFIENGVPMNDAIVKVAQDSGLNRLQIKRVTEMANHAANDTLRKTAEDKTFQFELADYGAVIDRLNHTGGTKDVLKTASVLDAIESRAGDELVSKLDAYAGMTKEAQDAQVREMDICLGTVVKWAETSGREAESKRLANMEDLGKDLDKLAQAAKNFIFNEGGRLDDLKKAAQLSDPEFSDKWQHVFEHVASSLKKVAEPYTGPLANALELTADYAGRHPQDLGACPSNDTLAARGPEVVQIARVQNGEGGLQMLLRPIRTKLKISEILDNWKNQVDSLASTVREEQRAITSSHSVTPEQYRYAQEMSKLASDGQIRELAAVAPAPTRREQLKAKGQSAVADTLKRFRTEINTKNINI